MLISTVSATVWRCKNCKWSENNNKKHIFFEHNMKRLTLVETLSKFYLTTLIYDFEKTNQTHVSATSTIILITKNPSLPLFYFLYLPVSISCIKSTICILPEGIFCPSQSPCNKVTLECCPQPPKKTLPKHIYYHLQFKALRRQIHTHNPTHVLIHNRWTVTKSPRL